MAKTNRFWVTCCSVSLHSESLPTRCLTLWLAIWGPTQTSRTYWYLPPAPSQSFKSCFRYFKWIICCTSYIKCQTAIHLNHGPLFALQLLFITDAQRRRIHSANHENSKPGRQVVTFLLICNLTMWVIYTFEVQKVQDSPIQVRSNRKSTNRFHAHLL